MMRRFGVSAVAILGCLALGAAPAAAGEIAAQGSDSTLALVKALAKGFEAKSGDTIKLAGGGSSRGAKEAIAGNVDLAVLSRGLNDAEKEAGLVGVTYAIDGVAVVVNPANPVEDISMADLKAIFTGEKTAWEDGKPVVAYTRNPDSGTREVFQDLVLGKDVAFGPKVQVKHDMAMTPAVKRIPGAIAYTSAGSVEDGLKVLSVNGVAPTPENLADHSYPIFRTPTLATKGEATGVAGAFLEFVKSPEGEAIIKHEGYLPYKK